MQITTGLRDLLIETAESLSGAERRHFMANTLKKLQLGQREAADLFGCGRDTLRKACHELRTGLTCADAFGLRGRKPVEFHLPHLFDDLNRSTQRGKYFKRPWGSCIPHPQAGRALPTPDTA